MLATSSRNSILEWTMTRLIANTYLPRHRCHRSLAGAWQTHRPRLRRKSSPRRGHTSWRKTFCPRTTRTKKLVPRDSLHRCPPCRRKRVYLVPAAAPAPEPHVSTFSARTTSRGSHQGSEVGVLGRAALESAGEVQRLRIRRHNCNTQMIGSDREFSSWRTG